MFRLSANLQTQLPEQSQPPAVQPESQDHEYILGEWEGRLAVYRTGESEPDSVLDVYLGLLPPADAQALREGIPGFGRGDMCLFNIPECQLYNFALFQ